MPGRKKPMAAEPQSIWRKSTSEPATSRARAAMSFWTPLCDQKCASYSRHSGCTEISNAPPLKRAETLAFLNQSAQFWRRLDQLAGCVEPRYFAVRPIEAEDPFEALDLAARPKDRPLRKRGIGVPQAEFRPCAKHLAVPIVELAVRRGRAHRGHHQRQAGDRCGNPQGTTARQARGRATRTGCTCIRCNCLFRHFPP